MSLDNVHSKPGDLLNDPPTGDLIDLEGTANEFEKVFNSLNDMRDGDRDARVRIADYIGGADGNGELIGLIRRSVAAAKAKAAERPNGPAAEAAAADGGASATQLAGRRIERDNLIFDGNRFPTRPQEDLTGLCVLMQADRVSEDRPIRENPLYASGVHDATESGQLLRRRSLKSGDQFVGCHQKSLQCLSDPW